MGNTFTWPLIRLVQRLSMVLTLACCAYVIFTLFSKTDNSNVVPEKGGDLISPPPVFDLKPYNASSNDQARDIFSLTSTTSTVSAVDNTPKGQLPDHLKIVGILISHPSQIIIEDGSTNKTYFIDENNPQGGIKIVRVAPDQMTINYQGQDIDVPINKN